VTSVSGRGGGPLDEKFRGTDEVDERKYGSLRRKGWRTWLVVRDPWSSCEDFSILHPILPSCTRSSRAGEGYDMLG
jgi:hypothetical protein